ncbi:hypothetical protein DV20_08720 [Amycolatopsis rifamycinica]|uniref:Uncharacterized protein n=1 Tax=Amycolatopsis rifamycinica TaxID=287986 RepID=A0A066U693_9PSEU|nr:hypothetical protein DV20_08720 [Amycolatopsis rifamycinica]
MRRLENDERTRTLPPAAPEPPAPEPAGSAVAVLEPTGSAVAAPESAAPELAASRSPSLELTAPEPEPAGAGPGPASEPPAPEPTGSGVAAPEPTGSGVAAPKPTGSAMAAPKPTGSAMAAPEPTGSAVAAPEPAGSAVAALKLAAPEPDGGAHQAVSLADVNRPATPSPLPPSPAPNRARWLPSRRRPDPARDLRRELDQLRKATKPRLFRTSRKARLIARRALLIAAVLVAAATIGLSLYLSADSADDRPVVPENGYELTWAAEGTPDGQTADATVGRHVPVTLGSPAGRRELVMTLRPHGTPPSRPYLRGTVSVDEKAKLCGPVTVVLGAGKVMATLHVGLGAGPSVAVPSSFGPLAGIDRISITIDPSAATTPPCGTVTLNFDNFVVTG